MEHIGSGRGQVVVVGANPALQKTCYMQALAPGAINRVERVTYGFGGKGQGCARAVSLLSRDAATVVSFLAGHTGERVSSFLEQAGVKHDSVWTKGETRTCTTLISTSKDASFRETEIIEPSPAVSEDEVREYVGKVAGYLDAAASSGRTAGLAIMGTCPPGAETLYKTIADMRKVSHPDVPILLDGYKGILPLLETGQIAILKINMSEFRLLAGEVGFSVWKKEQDSCIGDWLAHNSGRESIVALMERFALQMIALTDGPRPSVLFHLSTCSLHAWSFELPHIEIVNAIGCGDTVAGGFLHFLLEGLRPEEAFRRALAMASAAACTDSSAFYDVALANTMVEKIAAHPLL